MKVSDEERALRVDKIIVIKTEDGRVKNVSYF